MDNDPKKRNKIKPKDKYTKIYEELRSSKTESNLQKIYKDLLDNKSNLLDDDIIPFKFSNDLIWLLSNNIININIQKEIFKLYIDSFLTLKIKSENLQKLILLEQIFKHDSFLYKSTSDTQDFNCFVKKYFEKYFPKNKNFKLEPGEIVDVLIGEKDDRIGLIYGWLQLPIKRIENDYIIFSDFNDEKKEIKYNKDSYEIQEKNTFTTEKEMKWRKELKKGEKIDFLNENKIWLEEEILNVFDNNISISVIGIEKEENIIKSIYSPLIRPLLTFSFQYKEDEKKYMHDICEFYYFSKFEYCLPIPKIIEDKESNFLVPNNKVSFYSFLYYDIFNYFMNKLISCKIFEKENEDKLSIEYIYIIMIIFEEGYDIINHLFFGTYFKKIIAPIIKNILLKVSIDKTKNTPRKLTAKLFEIFSKYYMFSSNIFQTQECLIDFLVNFGFNCFKESENLEKRIIGLHIIEAGLKFLELFKDYKNNDKIKKIIRNILLIDNKNSFYQILYSKPNIHSQLFNQGTDIMIDCFKENILENKDIDKLYNMAISSEDDTDNCLDLYVCLINISKTSTLEQSQNMINRIINIPNEKIRKYDIHLMVSIIKNIKQEKDYKEAINIGLDFIYKYIIKHIPKRSKFVDDFGKIILNSINDDNVKIYFAFIYIEKIINELLNKINLETATFFYDFIFTLISFYNSYMANIMKTKLNELLNKNNNSEKLLNNLIEIIDKEEHDTETKIGQIMNIINSIESLISVSDFKSFYTIDSIIKLCDIFIFTKKNTKRQSQFLKKILFLKNKKYISGDFCDIFFKKFDLYLSGINKDNYMEYSGILNDEFIEIILKLYQSINNIFNEDNDDNVYIDENCYIGQNPLEFKYFNIIWKMFTKVNQSKLMKNFLSDFSLRLFSQKERNEIWEIIIKKIFDEQNNFINQNTFLNMINYIINFSEIYGTGGVTSHLIDKIKKYPLKLKIVSNIETFSDIELTDIYTTSTLYDVKKEIQKKLNIDPVFIDFSHILNNELKIKERMPFWEMIPLRNEKYINDYDNDVINYEQNGKNIFFILNKQNISSLDSIKKEDLEKQYTLIMNKSKQLTNMKKYKLIDDDNPDSLSEKMKSVLNKIFLKLTNNTEKMDKESFNDFTFKFIDDFISKLELEKMFIQFDKDKKGYLNFDDFINYNFYSFKNNRNSLNRIYWNLKIYGYRNDLELINTPIDEICPLYYEENNNYEYMPRYFIGNNKEYMNKLFLLSLSEDKSVHELALNIIKELSTWEQMKNLFLDNKEKIFDDLLVKNNLEMRTYAFDNIISDFEKYNESNNKEMKLDINKFIQKYFEKILNIFYNYMNNIKKEINNNKIFINK